jgi:hypothetical protein
VLLLVAVAAVLPVLLQGVYTTTGTGSSTSTSTYRFVFSLWVLKRRHFFPEKSRLPTRAVRLKGATAAAIRQPTSVVPL